jgi:hypothetical protein
MTNRRSMPAVSALGATDATVQPFSENSPVIENLWGDVVRVGAGETVRIDRDLDATVTNLGGNLSFLQVILWNTDGTDQVGIAEGDGIVLSGNIIEIDDLHIGTITFSGEDSIDIELTANATSTLVQRLIRAFTYKSTSTDPDAITRKYLSVLLKDANDNDVEAWVDIVVGPASVHVLTLDEDHLTGTEGADTFVTRYTDLTAGDQITGGEGSDTLRLDDGYHFDLTEVTLSSIETITGSANSADTIIISATQLEDISRIDGAGDTNFFFDSLYIRGTSIDLTGKTIASIEYIDLRSDNAEITVDSKDIALKVHGNRSRNDKLILTSGALSPQERLDLHRQGIETIVDETGAMTIHVAPVIANLGGDNVVSTGSVAVRLDAGANATVTDDDGQFSSLKVYVTSRTNSADVLGFDASSGVTVTESGIFVDGLIVGYPDNSSTVPGLLQFSLRPLATEAQVQKLLQSLTYRHSAGALGQDLEIKIELTDVGGRTTSQTVTVEAPPNTPAEIGNLDGDLVRAAMGEVVFLDRGFDATVIDPDDNLTYLEVWTQDLSDFDFIGISTESTGITISDDGKINVDNTFVGTIFDDSTGCVLSIELTDDATPELVTRLVRALTFKSTDPNISGVVRKQITVRVFDDGTNNHTDVEVEVAVEEAGNTPPTIGNLHLDVVTTDANEEVLLDLDENAIVSDLEGGLHHLEVFVWNSSDDSDLLGIRSGNGLTVSGDGWIWIDDPSGDIPVGQITASTGNSLRIDISFIATSELVQRVIRALTYKTTSETTSVIRKYIEIQLWDQGNDPAIANVDVLVAPSGMDVHVLTTGTDEFIGTGNDDTFVTRFQDLTAGDQIAGGGGNDTLLLHEGDWFDLTRITFTSIETIAGSAYSDGIIISSEQLAGVTAIHGGDDDYNGLHLTGTSINLTGKTITNITFIELKTDNAVITLGNEDLAKKVYGRTTQNDTLVLTTGRLDDAERLDLHRQGIETIVDGEGRSTTHIAPQIANLDGDRVSSTGRTPVLLDLGSNATLSDDDGQFTDLKVSVTSRTSPNDVFSLSSSSGVTVSQNGDIRIGDQSIASIYGGSEAASELTIHIYPTATEAQVQKLLQSLTYRHSAGALGQDLAIKIELTDIGGRTASHTVTVLASNDPGDPDPVNATPVNVRLNGDTTVSIAENTALAAALSATDGDNDPLTFSFDTGAAGGGNAGGMFVIDNATKQLKLAPGKALDFETAQSFTVYVKADDGHGGVSATQALTIKVTDVVEALVGVSRADKLVGGAGNDKLNGKAGKDVLTGNGGQDIFVFDTKPNKKTNLDTITDYSVAEDTIWLSDSVFKKLGKGSEASPTKLKKAFFKVADKAKDKNDYLVYNKKTGVLSYDADGSGSAKAVEIAKLTKNLKLTQDDFFVV